MENVAIGVGFISIPVIILLIQLLKRLLPFKDDVWLATSFCFGVASQLLGAWAIAPPSDLNGWLKFISAGIIFGLAASKAYDESIGRIKRATNGQR